ASHSVALSLLERVDQAGDRFEDAWDTGQRPVIEEYLADTPEPDRSALLHELLLLELGYRRQSGETPAPVEYLGRFPEHTALIKHAFRADTTFVGGMDQPPVGEMRRMEHEAHPARPREGSLAAPSQAELERWPTVPGYELVELLGRGGMGVVYRARDPRLDRVVALKMIRSGALASADELARFRSEASLQARMHHPHIVQI